MGTGDGPSTGLSMHAACFAVARPWMDGQACIEFIQGSSLFLLFTSTRLVSPEAVCLGAGQGHAVVEGHVGVGVVGALSLDRGQAAQVHTPAGAERCGGLVNVRPRTAAT